MNQTAKHEQLTNDAIQLYNNGAVNYEEFQDLLKIIKESEPFAAKFIATIQRIAKQTSNA